MAEVTKEQALEELKNRGILVSSESVFDEEGSTFEEFKKATTSLLKGSAKGIIDLVGGWGNVYEALAKSKDPNAFSSAGILKTIRDMGGPDLLQISGYRGAYELGQSGAPAAALTVAGVPGLFSRTPAGVAGEFAVQGSTGALASTVAPDSALAQLTMGSTPDLLKGVYSRGKSLYNAPSGQLPPNVPDLLRVGPLTPGEASGFRPQLAAEAAAEASPKSLDVPGKFRQVQAQSVTDFVDNIFKRSTKAATNVSEATNIAFNSFQNYGKALSSKLRSDAAKDFKVTAGAGKVSTVPILKVIDEQIAKIPPETPGFDALKASLMKIRDEYSIPAVAPTVTPSTILGPTGQPAAVTVTQGVPAGTMDIDLSRLQKNLSAWGEAAWSGKADFGKGNIFEGVAPGQAKGIAISVLNGFRNALDEAINSGVPGAQGLVKARDNFKGNLQAIEEFSVRPLTKYFDVPNISALTPELVISKLEKSPPTEKAFLAQVLQNNPRGAELLDTVRASEMQKILDKARIKGAAEGQPQYDLKALLQGINKDQGELRYLLPDAADRADLSTATTWLQKVLKTAAEKGGDNLVDTAAYGVTRGAGGTVQQSWILKELAGVVQFILDDPKYAAGIFFNPDTVKQLAKAQSKNNYQKTLDILKSATTVIGQQAIKAGPRMETTQPQEPMTEMPSMMTEEDAVITPDQALEQLKAMGIEVE